MHNILIAGAGQLGSRYLQGLAGVRADLNIVVCDPSRDALCRAEERWREVCGADGGKKVTFTEALNDVRRNLDLAIIATGADVRPAVTQRIATATPRYWVLEKVLGQSEAGIDAIEAVTCGADGVWVNTPRRSMSWHRELREALLDGRANAPMTVEVTGGAWGLASNSVHFLDLVQWWVGSPLVQIDTGAIDARWFESKRPGYHEVSGTLVAKFADGSSVRLVAAQEQEVLKITADTATSRWVIDEANGTAICEDGRSVQGRIQYQSELTVGLVESLFAQGRCELPTLAESAPMHRVFVGAMLSHWNRNMAQRATLPIT